MTAETSQSRTAFSKARGDAAGRTELLAFSGLEAKMAAATTRRRDPILSTIASQGLTVSSLEVWRGERHLFSDLDFALDAGEIALVTGPNGAGKTTLLRILAGLGIPQSGAVEWRGEPVRDLPPEERASVAYLGHLDGLKKNLTVVENLRFLAALWGKKGDIEAPLEALGLTEFRDRHVRYLSAGQKRRVSLAGMRLREASLWLLDEPLTNLDAAGADVVVDWLGQHAAAGGSAVVATHQTDRLISAASIEIEL